MVKLLQMIPLKVFLGTISLVNHENVAQVKMKKLGWKTAGSLVGGDLEDYCEIRKTKVFS